MFMGGGFFNLFSFLSLFLYFGSIIFVIYVVLQFLKESRERNDLLYQILQELRKKNSNHQKE